MTPILILIHKYAVNALSAVLLNDARDSKVYAQVLKVVMGHADKGDCERFFSESIKALSDPNITWTLLRKC